MSLRKTVLVLGSVVIVILAMPLVSPIGGMGWLRLEAASQEGRTSSAEQSSAQHEKSELPHRNHSSLIQGKNKPMEQGKLQFGNFSVSLAVKDLAASKAFYEKLDFQPVGGGLEQNFLIMQNGTTTIGLFHGMFEQNILTFNPGWNHKSETLEAFQDVRDLQAVIKERGISPVTEADPQTTGAASFVIVDPDGNTILVDQHVPKGD